MYPIMILSRKHFDNETEEPISIPSITKNENAFSKVFFAVLSFSVYILALCTTVTGVGNFISEGATVRFNNLSSNISFCGHFLIKNNLIRQ